MDLPLSLWSNTKRAPAHGFWLVGRGVGGGASSFRICRGIRWRYSVGGESQVASGGV